MLKKQKNLKLQLIRLLSDPDLIIEQISQNNEIIDVPDFDVPQRTKRLPSGRQTFSFVIKHKTKKQ